MILTGKEIIKKVRSGEIVIEPFNIANVEPNSYRFHLGDKLLIFSGSEIDALNPQTPQTIKIPESGFILSPKKFYLGCTLEHIGSHNHVSELYARLSTSLLGMFIQTSAPLGHTGAIIPWTLEIVTLNPIRIYPNMPIGKICFWETYGKVIPYDGRYKMSTSVVHSKLSEYYP